MSLNMYCYCKYMLHQYYILVQSFRVNWFFSWSIQYWRLWQIYMSYILIWWSYILIWRLKNLLLPHNLYSSANHIQLFYYSCWRSFYCDQTRTIKCLFRPAPGLLFSVMTKLRNPIWGIKLWLVQNSLPGMVNIWKEKRN